MNNLTLRFALEYTYCVKRGKVSKLTNDVLDKNHVKFLENQKLITISNGWWTTNRRARHLYYKLFSVTDKRNIFDKIIDSLYSHFIDITKFIQIYV